VGQKFCSQRIRFLCTICDIEKLFQFNLTLIASWRKCRAWWHVPHRYPDIYRNNPHSGVQISNIRGRTCLILFMDLHQDKLWPNGQRMPCYCNLNAWFLYKNFINRWTVFICASTLWFICERENFSAFYDRKNTGSLHKD